MPSSNRPGTSSFSRRPLAERVQEQIDAAIAEFAADKRLLRHAAPELVAAAEAVLRGKRPDPAVFADAAAGLRSQPGGDAIDTVVLACTHFPLVEDQLRAALGADVRFVHGAEGIARRVASLTQGQQFDRRTPDFALFTGDPDQFITLLPALKAYGLDSAERF